MHGTFCHSPAVTQQPVKLSLDVTDTLGFQSLRDDPRAVLAIHFHGAGDNMGSGHRIPNYRALAAGSPERIHILTLDYGGFGNTPGVPTEDGLIQDAIAVVDWALNVGKIPPSRILIVGKSLGTAVNMAVAEHFAMQHDPVLFAGHILVAPFVDLLTLATTYKIAGMIPIMSPVAQYPVLFNFLSTHIRDTWSTKTCIARFVRRSDIESPLFMLRMIPTCLGTTLPRSSNTWSPLPAKMESSLLQRMLGERSYVRILEPQDVWLNCVQTTGAWFRYLY
jgi:abhydrolase domain-containing protein 12